MTRYRLSALLCAATLVGALLGAACASDSSDLEERIEALEAENAALSGSTTLARQSESSLKAALLDLEDIPGVGWREAGLDADPATQAVQPVTDCAPADRLNEVGGLFEVGEPAVKVERAFIIGLFSPNLVQRISQYETVDEAMSLNQLVRDMLAQCSSYDIADDAGSITHVTVKSIELEVVGDDATGLVLILDEGGTPVVLAIGTIRVSNVTSLLMWVDFGDAVSPVFMNNVMRAVIVRLDELQ